MSATRPIGVFDSGLGGLSVLKELKSLLPAEDFLYLGDVARLPYGTKSAETVARYGSQCVALLRERSVKAVVVACNTASASALDVLAGQVDVDVVGVIEPGVAAGAQATRTGRVLVLATAATVASEAYLKEFQRQAPHVSVEQVACPLLVPLAEEGWFDHPVTDTVLEGYLARARDLSFDTVVLGCTHYPLLMPSLRRVLGPGISLVHGGPRLAVDVKARLAAKGLLNPSPVSGSIRLLATDTVAGTRPIVEALFGEPLPFEPVDLR